MSTLVALFFPLWMPHSQRVQFRWTQVRCKKHLFIYFIGWGLCTKLVAWFSHQTLKYFSSSSCVLADCFSTRSFVFLSSSVFLSFLSLCWSLSKAGLLGDWRRRESVINLINWFWDVNQMKPVPVGAWGQHGGVSLRWGFCWNRLPTIANGFSMFC